MTKTCFADSEGIIYIRADGSIDPPTAPISTLDNVTYTLIGDIFNDSIVIERDNIVVDGAGYMVENGIGLETITNVTIKNMTTQGISLNHYSNYNTIFGNNIKNNWGLFYSLSVTNSRNNTICGNNITNNGGGISLYNAEGNIISGNNIIANNAWGISMGYYSGNNTIYGNNIKNNFSGIALDSSSNNNTIYHNNFINNYSQVSSEEGSTNVWDNGFEGNYWSGYNGTDSNQDGIGDTPYIIYANNTDHYPLMGTFQSFNVSNLNMSYDEISIVSNSTVEQAEFVLMSLEAPQPYFEIVLAANGQNGTIGFCRITFQNELLNSSTYPVSVAGNAVASRIIESNGTHTTLYFTFNQTLSSYQINILPEFPSFLILPLFMIATLLAFIVFRRKHQT